MVGFSGHTVYSVTLSFCIKTATDNTQMYVFPPDFIYDNRLDKVCPVGWRFLTADVRDEEVGEDLEGLICRRWASEQAEAEAQGNLTEKVQFLLLLAVLCNWN